MKILLLAALLALTNAVSEIDMLDAYYLTKTSSCDYYDVQAWKCPSCSYPTIKDSVQTKVITDFTTGGQVVVNYNPTAKRIQIAFRGSKNIANWLANLSYGQVAFYPSVCLDCKVHAGFLDSYNAVSAAITDQVKLLQKQWGAANPLFITGHSLGGALASIAAVDLAIKFPNTKISLFTFGSPRTANRQFFNFFTLKT